VQWNFRDPNACGGCINDFSVSVEEIELEDDVRIDVAARDCTSCPWDRDVVDTNDQRTGIQCRYGDWRDWSPSVFQAGSKIDAPATTACAMAIYAQ
jgi:hypothetical protein